MKEEVGRPGAQTFVIKDSSPEIAYRIISEIHGMLSEVRETLVRIPTLTEPVV